MASIVANEILLNNAQRLGISDDSTIKKADEFLRILQSKNTLKTLTDMGKIILCLDLATTQQGLSFDKATAIKLSGLKKTVYQNSLNNIEKMLNLDKILTISELCVQFSCTVVQTFAEYILENYKNYDGKIKDINHPQYPAAAVFTACKLKNIKIDNNKLATMSRLKTTQWKELINEFDRFTKTLSTDKNKAKTTIIANKSDQLCDEEEVSQKSSKNCAGSDNQIEDYEVWRERILREAAAELLQAQLQD